MYFKAQPSFYNLVLWAKLKAGLNPFVLLGHVKAIEYELGRQASTFRNGPRQIDIDLLDIEDTIIDSDILKLPHPKMKERNFVLKPLAEINPGYVFDNVLIGDFLKTHCYKDKVKKLKNGIELF